MTRRPHRMSAATAQCVNCDQWIREYGPIDRTNCPRTDRKQ